MLVSNPTVSSATVAEGGTRITAYQRKGWAKRLKEGDDATTYLSGTRVRVKQENARWRRSVRPQFQGQPIQDVQLDDNIYHANIIPTLPDVSVFDKAVNQAQIAFLGNIAKKRRLFQTGVFLGELPEMLRLLKSPLRSIRKGLDDYVHLVKGGRGRNRNRIGRNNTYISDMWLEYVYGIQPLVADAKSAAQAAFELYTSRKLHSRVTHKPSRVVSPVSDVVGATYSDTLSQINCRRLIEAEVSCQFRGVMNIDADKALGTRDAISSLGFSPRDFVPTVWELLPWSFVFDYFTNCGDLLEALSTGTGSLRWYARTTREVATATWYDAHALPYSPQSRLISESLDPGSLVISRERVLRQSLYGTLSPQFEWKIPGFQSRKWLNLAALARSTLTKGSTARL